MKKTLQTAMTAAMFAASLGMAAGTASASQAGESDAAAVEKLMNATAGEVVDVYGPPEAFYTETEPLTTTTTEAAAPPEETTDPDYDEPVTGGVVPLPTLDLDGNGQFDARDLTILKQYMLQNPKPAHGFDFTYSSDYNYDGILDKQDLIQMILELTGMPEWNPEETAVTTTTTAVFPTTETTITMETDPAPVYGPPLAYDSE